MIKREGKGLETRQSGMKSLLFAVALVAGLYAIMQVIGITCPIKFITGISCPGCGMSRAIFSAIQLNLVEAFYYHPLFWLPLVWILAYILKGHINGKTFNILTLISIALFCIIYLFRMIYTNSTIVTFEPERGFIGQLLRSI